MDLAGTVVNAGAAAGAGWVSPAALRVEAPVRLFCFAHAGGSGAFFRGWQRALLPEVAVLPVVLPGREARVREAPVPRIEPLLGPLADGLAGHLDRPFALFGHSMGAVLAYEVARRLAGPGQPPLLHLFVSGRRAPQLPSRRRPLYTLPDDEFVAAMAAMGGMPPEVLQRDVLEVFLPRLRADVELNERYTPLPGPVLACPVTALTGDTDTEVDPPEMAAWQHTTGGDFVLRAFHGGHFYLTAAEAQVLAIIKQDLRNQILALD